MPTLLKAAQGAKHHRVPEVDIGAGRIQAQLDAQPVPALEARPQVLAIDDLDRARRHGFPLARQAGLIFLHRIVSF